MKYTTIYLSLRSPKGKLVNGTIVVRDGFALSTFTDPNLAKQLYDYDIANGEDVAYNKKHNAYIKRYPKMKKEAIVKKLKVEIQNAGGQLLWKLKHC